MLLEFVAVSVVVYFAFGQEINPGEWNKEWSEWNREWQEWDREWSEFLGRPVWRMEPFHSDRVLIVRTARLTTSLGVISSKSSVTALVSIRNKIISCKLCII
ncbi:unnamed protein product [Cylicocyclus nassatus]|uniref:Uncharacterized protein n=1 Tax=Cylicocyclus nassatus TaxID=53992 RepID=A0AA36M5F8_CYLNA|nr:unnamed protein product [Cylicocyclus nassatus]